MLRVDVGKGADGTDRFTLQTPDDRGFVVNMASVFHGAAALRTVINELDLGLKKYTEWKAQQVPPVEGEMRRMEITT